MCENETIADGLARPERKSSPSPIGQFYHVSQAIYTLKDVKKLIYIHPYLENREFRRKKNRTKSWVFRCKECGKRVDDAIEKSYWYRNDICQLFCSAECAISHDELYEFEVRWNGDPSTAKKFTLGGKLSREDFYA